MTKTNATLGIALAMLALSGCKREATGQVAAVVNGDEITLQEVNAEIGTTELPKNVDRKAIQSAALQRIIDRRLAAGAARDDGIDKDPQYLARQRRVDEMLLIEMLGQKLQKAQRMPDAATIDKYMADHPERFAQRVIYSADRIQFAMPADPQTLQPLKDDHSMDAVAKRLTSMGIKFQRGGGGLDSATLPPQFLARLKALPPGEPFLVPENGIVTVAALTGSQPAPLTGADARPKASMMMRNEELGKQLQDRVKAKRDAAKIEYQQGFAPPAKPGAPAKP
ncbi:MAG: hypothetical protein KGM17_02710 [Sphingomonadales bacterium]|nr:hypothetical protein [Sphingomonadales bacterium]